MLYARSLLAGNGQWHAISPSPSDSASNDLQPRGGESLGKHGTVHASTVVDYRFTQLVVVPRLLARTSEQASLRRLRRMVRTDFTC